MGHQQRQGGVRFPARPSTFHLVVSAICLGSAACGAPDGLGRDDVTTIGPGDASGAEWGGVYSISVRTEDCEGSCSVEAEYFTASICDVGDVDTEAVLITQDDGALSVEWDEPLSLLEGGVDADGTFEVGGFGTESGGDLEISLRVDGTFSGAILSARARSWSVGEVMDDGVDCLGHYVIEGTRSASSTGDGAPRCTSDDDCPSETPCNNKLDVCASPGPDGSPCIADDECQNGRCNNQLDTCQPPGPAGTPCVSNDECLSGNCNNADDLCL
jgi:hypothetical protein